MSGLSLLPLEAEQEAEAAVLRRMLTVLQKEVEMLGTATAALRTEAARLDAEGAQQEAELHERWWQVARMTQGRCE